MNSDYLIDIESSQLMLIDGGSEEGAYEAGKAIGEGMAAGFMVIGIILIFI